MGFSDNDSLYIRKKTSLKHQLQRYCNTRKCISSKAALLVLLWSFMVSLLYSLLIYSYIPLRFYLLYTCKIIIPFGYAGIVYCFYPIAGHLADTKYGRYKMILTSLWMILLTLVLGTVGAGVLVLALLAITDLVSYGIFILTIIIGAIICFVAFILLIVGIAGFSANMIQFGLDQLHDSPGEDQSLFIHWYMWSYYAAVFIANIVSNITLVKDPLMYILETTILGFTFFMVILLLLMSLSVAHCNRSWFLIEPSRLNPYKLVYKVSKFAHQHKVPVHRSAFTYCEDEVPSGLDLGKDKYGGPFTTEQVEDVKTFYGIAKVLFSLGPVFYVDIASYTLLSSFSRHVSSYDHFNSDQYCSNVTLVEISDINEVTTTEDLFLTNDTLYPLTAFLCIPLHLFILQPLIKNYIPGMLRRMGIGILVTLLSLISTFIMDTMIHVENKTLGCMFNNFRDYNDLYNSSIASPSPTEHGDTYIKHMLIFQHILTALSNMLFYTALYEFICSQSPYSMKGLFIGLSYAIRGLFEILGSIMLIPFDLGWYAKFFPSCGMVYYIVHIGVGMCGLLVYVRVSTRYKFRERDEPCNVHRYVEEYYSNIQQERFYDYD